MYLNINLFHCLFKCLPLWVFQGRPGADGARGMPGEPGAKVNNNVTCGFTSVLARTRQILCRYHRFIQANPKFSSQVKILRFQIAGSDARAENESSI